MNREEEWIELKRGDYAMCVRKSKCLNSEWIVKKAKEAI